jgi:hypothetical protein
VQMNSMKNMKQWVNALSSLLPICVSCSYYMLVLLTNYVLYFSFILWECSTGCRTPMIKMAVLIRKRDFPWLCSVTGEFTLKRKEAEMFTIAKYLTHTHTHTHAYTIHISFESFLWHNWRMNLFSGNTSFSVLLIF